MTTVPAIQLASLSKSFGGVTVLRDIDLTVRRGEVHGLVGENGSGKSTLVKILAGVHAPDRGSEVDLWGKPASMPVHPADHGIAIIHQDLALVEEMSVLDNIGVGSSFGTAAFRPIRTKRERQIAADLLAEFDLTTDPAAAVAVLSPAERSIVAILRALRQLRSRPGDNHILILDEPTAALPRSESQHLLAMIKSIAARGVAVVLISHRMGEVLSTCDRISVLRSGALVTTMDAADATQDSVVRHMLGYDLGEFYPGKQSVNHGEVTISISGLSGGGVSDISFEVRRGEILGVTGLAGMGQDEIPYLIYGGLKRRAGHVLLDGRALPNRPRVAKRRGVALVPGNRGRDAIWADGTARENLTLPFLHRYSTSGSLRLRRERRFTQAELDAHNVRPPLPNQHLARFSGGNQQKIVLARCLQLNPSVVLLHEPTQGVDAGAKKEILNRIHSVARSGTAVLLFSSDCEEVAKTCNRVIVMGYGELDTQLTDAEVTEGALLHATQVAGSRDEGDSKP